MRPHTENVFVDPAKFDFEDARQEIFRDAVEHNMPARAAIIRRRNGETNPKLELDFRNGRRVRRVPIEPTNADALRGQPFYSWEFIGDFWAMYYPELRMIEAALDYNRESRKLPANRLVLLPNVEMYDHEELNPGEYTRNRGVTFSRGSIISDFDGKWRLRLEDQATTRVAIEMSPMLPNRMPKLTDYISESAFFPWPYPSLKLKNVDLKSHDELFAIVEDYSNSLLFELDLQYQINMSLVRSRTEPYEFTESGLTGPPVRLPRNRYSAAAIELYSYARSAFQTPLLEYLSYYQAIEYFFPSYWNAEVSRRVKHKLKDPRFNRNSDNEIASLIALVLAGSKGGQPSEREQLRATIGSCVTEEALQRFIEADPERQEFLADKSSIRNVQTVNSKNPTTTITAQVATRIYDLRCRIVHGKSDGGPAGSEMLLPFSEESKLLRYDLELIRFMAQEVIVDGAEGLLP